MEVVILNALRAAKKVQASLFSGECLGEVTVLQCSTLHTGGFLEWEVQNQGITGSISVIVSLEGRGIYRGLVSIDLNDTTKTKLSHLTQIPSMGPYISHAARISPARVREMESLATSACSNV